MTPHTFNYTTGSSPLPDIGILFYNGCIFSPLYETKISGTVVKDDAQRTTKYMEYMITADGYVTLTGDDTSIDSAMIDMRKLLTAQGGHLIYKGRGCDIEVNSIIPNIGSRDVAWGPIPELLEFQPLGAGRSAKIQWQVKIRIPEIKKAIKGEIVGYAFAQLLQFNYETTVSYGEDGYSTLTTKGMLEVPLTRTPKQTDRKLPETADAMRSFIEESVMTGIDMTRFRLTRREINLSRDKRTIEWSITAEEKPYMDLPSDCTLARGGFTVRPARAGMGLASWLCSLRATYTVRRDRPRRMAWLMFLSLLRLRMNQSKIIDFIKKSDKITKILDEIKKFKSTNPKPSANPNTDIGERYSKMYGDILRALENKLNNAKDIETKRIALLIDFSVDEGLYLDSKTTTFSATWRIVVPFEMILLASGLWVKLPEDTEKRLAHEGRDGKLTTNLWKISMDDINGMNSWQKNKADPKLDIIVDFGY